MRICQLALLHVCGVMRRLLSRGVTHGDIHDKNVLMIVDDNMCTLLLDFCLAEWNTACRSRSLAPLT